MSVFESLKETTNKATTTGENYFETTKKYYELKVFQQLAMGIGLILKMAIIGGLLFVGLIFSLIAATVALGNYLGNTALAAIIVALILVVLAVLCFFLRKIVDKAVIKKLAKEFFEETTI